MDAMAASATGIAGSGLLSLGLIVVVSCSWEKKNKMKFLTFDWSEHN